MIGIIAVLVGLLLPVLSKARERSQRTACQANLRTIGQSFYMYANAYQDRLPNGNPPQTWSDPTGADAVMTDFASNFVLNPKVFWCPSSPVPVNQAVSTAEIGTLTQPITDSARISYDFYSLYWAPEYGPLLTRMKGKAPLAWDLNGGLLMTPTTSSDVAVQNHGSQGGNVLFADGHVEFQDRAAWDDTDWPDPANLYYPVP